MGIVHEAIENGVGVSGVADHCVPIFDGKLAGDDGGSAAVALFEDFEQVVTGLGIKRFKSPIVKNEKLNAAKRAGDAAIATVAAGKRLWRTSYEDFEAVGAARLPRTILFAEGDGSYDDGVEIKVKDRTINQAAAEGSFVLAPPPGAAVRDVGCGP